jgi:biopolymer transport protein ExbD
MGKVKRAPAQEASIPTAAMPDIIFMLLIFFMVVTSFKQFDGLPVLTPEAKSTVKIEAGKRDIVYIWADKNDRVMLDDQFFPLEILDEMAPVLYDRRQQNPKMVISLKADRTSHMKIINDVQQQCRKAFALRISYSTRFKN